MEAHVLWPLVAVLVVFKILFWSCFCYRRSHYYSTRCNNQPYGVTIPNTSVNGTGMQNGNGIGGIENPGYLQQPPPYTTVYGQQDTN